MDKQPELLRMSMVAPDQRLLQALEQFAVFGLWGERRLLEFSTDDAPDEKERKALLALLQRQPEAGGNILLLRFPSLPASKWLKEIQTLACFVECPGRMSPADCRSWLARAAVVRGLKLSTAAVKELVERLGPQPGILENALLLIELSGRADKLWDVVDIQDYFISETQNTVFSLTEALAEKNLQKSLGLVDWFMEHGVKVPELIGGLRTQFHKLLLYATHKSRMNRQGMMQLLDINKDWLFEKTSRQAEKFTAPRLKKIYAELYNLDRESKMGHGRDRDLLEMFILKLFFGA